jgi:hypothetical protein
MMNALGFVLLVAPLIIVVGIFLIVRLRQR